MRGLKRRKRWLAVPYTLEKEKPPRRAEAMKSLHCYGEETAIVRRLAMGILAGPSSGLPVDEAGGVAVHFASC